MPAHAPGSQCTAMKKKCDASLPTRRQEPPAERQRTPMSSAREESELAGARQTLERELATRGGRAIGVALGVDEANGTARARILRRRAGVVRGQAPVERGRDAGVERAVRALEEVAEPSHPRRPPHACASS